jgi:TPR repeat protein
MRRATAFEGDGDETQPNAVQLYCVAARLGDSEAQYRLGLMLLEGRGSRRNVESAATLFSLAAGTGHEDATTMLSIIGIKRETWPECFANVFPAIVDCQ